eukprot:jgi/Mesvir1/29767/Mv13857-RA.2
MHKWESAGLSLPLVSFTTGSQLWVVFRFLNGGPCSSILSSCFPKGLDEPLIASLGRGVLRVLKALHAEGYTHGDVGAASIYLEAYPPDPSSCKPSSSKPSSSKASSSMASTSAVSAVATGGMRVLGTTFNALTGTRTFLPGSKPWLSTSTPSDDMLAFGMLLMELATGEPPTSPEAGQSEFGKKDVSEEFRNAVSRCLDPSTGERATARQLLSHAFFKKALPEEHAIPDFLATLPPLGKRIARPSGAYRCCWGCGKVLEVPSASLVFKCGYCGAVTDGRTRKRQRQSGWCCMFARMGHALTVGFVVLLTLGIIASGAFLLFPLIFPQFRGALFWVHALATGALSFNTLFNFVAAAMADPGQPVSVPYGSTTVVGSRTLEDYTLCKLCSQPKPPRAHHCRVCQKCVLDMDHHCPFIGNCVGLRNQRHFLLFVSYAILSCAYVVGMCGWAATTSWDELAPAHTKLRGYNLPRKPRQMWMDMIYGVIRFQMPWQGVFVVLLAFVSSAVVLALSVLLGLHVSAPCVWPSPFVVPNPPYLW